MDSTNFAVYKTKKKSHILTMLWYDTKRDDELNNCTSVVVFLKIPGLMGHWGGLMRTLIDYFQTKSAFNYTIYRYHNGST